MVKHREHRNGTRVALAHLSVELPGAASAPADEAEALLEAPASGNISTGGVGFTLRPGHRVLGIGDRITIRFSLPDSFDQILVRAEVRHVAHRTDGGQRVGARFLDADELVENPLFRYVEEAVLAVRATSQTFIDGLAAP